MIELNLFSVGIGIGLMGSLHCIGMCGPLYIAIHSGTKVNLFQNQFFYFLGKTVAYLTIGLIAGSLASGMSFFLNQQQLSIILGLGFVVMFLFGILGQRFASFSNFTTKISRFFSDTRPDNLILKRLSLGLANGFLPCGLVYTAAAAGISGGNIRNSMWMMFGFGIGTMPSLFLMKIAFDKMPKSILKIWQQFYRYILLIVGVLLILRGLNLGIPFLSPLYVSDSQKIEKCCSSPR